MALRPLHKLLLILARQWIFLGPAVVSAQRDMMSWLSLAPPTSVARTTIIDSDTAAAVAATTGASTALTSTAAAADSTAMTTILYPSGLPTVNYEDTVLVSYDTPWQGTKLSVYCEDGQGGYVSYNDGNNLPSSGVVNLSPIEGTLNLSDYPAQCHILLTDSTDSGQWINDGVFTLTSTSGAVTTYGASSTGTAPTAAGQQTQTDATSLGSAYSSSGTNFAAGSSTSRHADAAPQTSSASGAAASSSTVPSSTTSSSDPSSSSSSSPSSSSSSSSSNHGLSGGAKAGIAIAVLLIFAILVFAAFIYHRRRRNNLVRLAGAESELASERARRAPEKPYVDSMVKSARKTESTLGRKVLSAEDMRQSGDWKRFFSAKAASAAGSLGEAAAAVGSAISNSRPGSRRASMARSRLGTGSEREQKELPQVPPLPARISVATMPQSVSCFSDSVAGDGTEYRSTTALIAHRKGEV